MLVFVLEWFDCDREYYGGGVAGIYSTRENAEAAMAASQRSDVEYEISEHEVDPQPPDHPVAQQGPTREELRAAVRVPLPYEH